MERIVDDINDKAMRVKAEDWGLRSALKDKITQWPECLLHLIRKIELNK